MRFFTVILLGLAFPWAAPAEEAPRVWRALSGDRVVLDGTEYRLSGVDCPAPETDAGRAAKALLNTYLRGGYLVCDVDDGRAACRRDGRDVAEGLIESGHCRGTDAEPLPEDARRLDYDLRRTSGTRAQQARGKRRCDASDRFVARAQAQACSRGVPFSLCEGVTGLRQFGDPVARSDRYRGTGDAAPDFRALDCQ